MPNATTRKRKSSRKRASKKRYAFRWWHAAIAFVLVALFAASYPLYLIYVQPAGKNKEVAYLCLKQGSLLSDIEEQLRTNVQLLHPGLFHRYAEHFKMNQTSYEGRFEVRPNMSIRDIVRTIMNDNETLVPIRLGHIRTKEALAGVLAKKLMLTRDELLEDFADDDFCKHYGFNTYTIPLMFLPDTARLKWSCTPTDVADHFRDKYRAFWSMSRLEKARKLGFSATELGIIASIVEQESREPSDWPAIARVYINRLKKGMMLQSDPTVKFALGDFDLRRIMEYHLTIDSEYNTYRHHGLPPGPICIPQRAVIDSVLNAPEKNYIYMCAKADFSGKHEFTDSYAQHLLYARKYRDALDRRGIK